MVTGSTTARRGSSPPNSANPVEVTMDQARSVVASYKTQFQLNLATNPPAVGASHISGASDGDWFDDGAKVTLTADATVAKATGSRYAFKAWTGDVASAPNSANPVEVTMDQARSVVASYKTQFQLNLATDPAAVGASHIAGASDGDWFD